MDVDVVFLPRDLRPRHLAGRWVAVFDVLRATTTMTAALAAGVREIRVYADLAAAERAARGFDGPRVLCGERDCLPPAGFDLGNSPGAFAPAAHGGRVAFMSTTNGTKAIVAARSADRVFAAALVNADAVARALLAPAAGGPAGGRDVTLLCAGTNDDVAMEDVIGAGAVLDALVRQAPGDAVDVRVTGDAARMAVRLFAAARGDLPAALADAAGGRNVRAAGLPEDVEFAARLNVLTAVGVVEGGAAGGKADVPVVRPWVA